MGKIYFSLVIHSHQPVGNFGFVFEKAYRLAYEPMLALLERHPLVKCTLHYSGCLLDWIFENRPDFESRVRRLVERGQVEIMTGGYYEPILVAIPEEDKKGQIAKLSNVVRERFTYDPRGAWLAERVWEPHLAENFCDSGVEYTIVDDTHFKYAGLEDKDLYGYYITEEQGKPLKIFSTLKELRYSIPWSPVEDVISWFKEMAENSTSPILALMGDDGEKFGLWPGTFSHCWGEREKFGDGITENVISDEGVSGDDIFGHVNPKDGWMERFFTELEANSDWLKTITPSEYIGSFEPLGRIYLPTASYDEMTEWVLPPELGHKFKEIKRKLEDAGMDDVERFLKGGFWRNYMVKYDEINSMHKKMLRVSAKVHQVLKGLTVSFPSADRIDKVDRENMLSHLWAGQCNCPYWHGVFGGVYLFHLRSAIYENLIYAENLADKLAETVFSPKGNIVSYSIEDFDRDGSNEILVESPAQNIYIDPDRGGAIFEWDWKKACFNLVNVMTRRRESYHSDFLEAVRDDRLILATGGASKETGRAGDASSEDDASTSPESIHSEKVRVKEKGLEKRLFYDRARRMAFTEHFFDIKTRLDDLYKMLYEERGNFAGGKYQYDISEEGEKLAVKLVKTGRYMENDVSAMVELEKEYTIYRDKARFSVSYRLRELGNGVQSGNVAHKAKTERMEALFGVETNWALMGGTAENSFMKIKVDSGREMRERLDSRGYMEGAKGVEIYLSLLNMKLTISWDENARLVWYPIETISNSEEGFERIYQGLCLFPMWKVAIHSGMEYQRNILVATERWEKE